MPTLADLRAERIRLCRLTADRALESVDDAEAFLHDRRMLTLVADSSLPSLFGATHEEPYAAVKAGFGSWPKTKWRWGGELAARPGVLTPKIHRGKILFLSREAATVVDPLCRESLGSAEDGSLGADAAAIVRHLAEPANAETLLRLLGNSGRRAGAAELPPSPAPATAKTAPRKVQAKKDASASKLAAKAKAKKSAGRKKAN